MGQTHQFNLLLWEMLIESDRWIYYLFQACIVASMAKSSQLMPLINTGNYQGGTNDKPGPTI